MSRARGQPARAVAPNQHDFTPRGRRRPVRARRVLLVAGHRGTRRVEPRRRPPAGRSRRRGSLPLALVAARRARWHERRRRRRASTCRFANAVSVVAGLVAAGRVGLGTRSRTLPAVGDGRAAGRGGRVAPARAHRQSAPLPLRRRAAGPRCTSRSRSSPTRCSSSRAAGARADGPREAAAPAAARRRTRRRCRRCSRSSASCSGWSPSGFVLLTLTLASGILFSEQLFGKPLDVHAQERVLGARLAHVRRAAGRPLALRLARPRRAALDPRRHRASSSSPTSAASSCSRSCSGAEGTSAHRRGRHPARARSASRSPCCSSIVRVLLDRRDRDDGGQPLSAEAPRAARRARRASSRWRCSRRPTSCSA